MIKKYQFLGISKNSTANDGTIEIVQEQESESQMGRDEDTSNGLRRSTRTRTQKKPFPGMRAFVARIGKDGDPVMLREVLDEYPMKWRNAIAYEYLSHKENGTWKPANLLPGKKALSSKWVFKKKMNADESTRQ